MTCVTYFDYFIFQRHFMLLIGVKSLCNIFLFCFFDNIRNRIMISLESLLNYFLDVGFGVIFLFIIIYITEPK